MELKRPNRIEYPITVNAIEYKRSEAIEPPLGKKVIRTPEDLKTITDDTIDNVWYVQALKQLDQADAQRGGNDAGDDV